MTKAAFTLLTVWLFLVPVSRSENRDQTVGVFVNTEDAFVGYTLFAPMEYHLTYLIDNQGNLIHFWRTHEVTNRLECF